MTNRSFIKRTISEQRAYSIIRRPIISEKSTNVSQFNQYAFEVQSDAAKPEIKQAIEMIFKVKVESVNTLTRPGKEKRFKGRIGRRQDKKRAYVTLVKGQTIDIGAGA